MLKIKITMRRIRLIAISLILMLTVSCVTTRETNVPNSSTISNLEKDRIEVLGHVEGNSGGGRMWVLFIPLGWARDSWIEDRAYEKAMEKYTNADGLMEQKQTYHKTSVPLIVLTPQVKKVKVTGVAYHIRTDEELEAYLKNRK